MGSLIIKPVQRIMKYPLLLGELWHATPEDHPDYHPLQKAFTAAKIINVNINEFKRRKDIGDVLFKARCFIVDDDICEFVTSHDNKTSSL